MAYATTALIEDAAGGPAALIELTDLDAVGTLDTTRLGNALAAAERWIDSYAQRRHLVPLADPVPEIVQRYAAEETVYLLKRNRKALDEQDQVDHDERLRWLEQVSRGEVSLGVDPPPTASSSVRPSTGDRADVAGAVTRDSLKGLW